MSPREDRARKGSGRAFLASGRQWTPFDYFRPQRWHWRFLFRRLDAALGRQSPTALTRLRLVGLRWFWLDGLFSTVSENFYVGFVSLFALAYGATKGQLGLLASTANMLGMMAFFPGAALASRVQRRKPLVLWTGGGVSRVAILLMALSPLLIRTPGLMVPLIIALNGVYALSGNLGNPAWTSIVADLVPPEARGRYFSRRNIAMAVAALIISPLAGQIVRRVSAAGSGIEGYQVAFLLAFLFGLAGTLSFSRIPEHGARRVRSDAGGAPGLLEALRNNRAFAGFAVSAFVWNLGLQISSPFFNPFIVTDLGGDATVVGIAAGCFSLTSLLGQRVFGALIDRRGNLVTQRVTGLLIPLIPAVWAVIRVPFHAYLIETVAGFLWAGYRLANFNLLLELSPEEDRPGAVALYQTVVFASAVLGPLLGGFLAEALGYRAVFAVSAGGRMVGTLLFIALVPVRPMMPPRR